MLKKRKLSENSQNLVFEVFVKQFSGAQIFFAILRPYYVLKELED